VVRKYPRTDWAEEAQFLAGWLEYNRGDFRAALPGLRTSLERYPNSKWADDARWYLAYSHYLLGEHPQALAELERLSRRGGKLEGGKARYWKARTLFALGKKDQAVREWRELVGWYPFSWYSILSRARLKEQGIKVGPFGDRGGNEGGPRLGDIDKSLENDPLIARVDELIDASMGVEAGFELRRGEGEFLRRNTSARGLPILLDRYRKASNFNRPWALSEAYGGRALDLPPDDGARAWWENHYPLAYKDFVDKYQDVGKNPPLYLYAIMWKESGFHPHDVSYADAIGLLQMIPPTTRRVAPEVGLEYTDDLLYDPERNIQVGSWYIGSLAQKFKFKYQIPIASGSFNSGPRPVMKWLDKFGDRPIDEFVELVAYSQTREYMKKVTDAYARYLYLYKGVDYEQPLTVDKNYVKNDLEY
jgi:soluble lytic murein transglycosylase